MLKQAAVILAGLMLCAPAIAAKKMTKTKVVYVVERPLIVERAAWLGLRPMPIMRSDVVLVRNPNGTRSFYAYPRGTFFYY